MITGKIVYNVRFCSVRVVMVGIFCIFFVFVLYYRGGRRGVRLALKVGIWFGVGRF